MLLIISIYIYFVVLLTQITTTSACDLVPDNSGSCFDLRSTSYIGSGDSQFGNFIEGASVDAAGDMYAVNFGSPQSLHQLGRFFPSQGLFYEDQVTSSHFNGIRFLNTTRAFVADVVNHRVLKLDIEPSPGAGSVVVGSGVYCADPSMLQPNDLTLAVTGTVFTSGMRWLSDTNDTHGDIWVCTPSGRVRLIERMGRTNGVELSPDDRTLYVSESYNRGGTPYVQKIWKYNADTVIGSVRGKTLFVDFANLDGSASVDIDGMRTDVNGNLYVTRHGSGHVVILSPMGEIIGRITLTFPNPTNLEFGGPNGTTLFVVGACPGGGIGCVDTIQVVTPGRAWSLMQKSNN